LAQCAAQPYYYQGIGGTRLDNRRTTLIDWKDQGKFISVRYNLAVSK
jgi:hypothetical protein